MCQKGANIQPAKLFFFSQAFKNDCSNARQVDLEQEVFLTHQKALALRAGGWKWAISLEFYCHSMLSLEKKYCASFSFNSDKLSDIFSQN